MEFSITSKLSITIELSVIKLRFFDAGICSFLGLALFHRNLSVFFYGFLCAKHLILCIFLTSNGN